MRKNGLRESEVGARKIIIKKISLSKPIDRLIHKNFPSSAEQLYYTTIGGVITIETDKNIQNASMTNEQIVLLIQQGQDTKNNLELLYTKNKRFIYKTARVYADHNNDIDDLMQNAYFGLVNAVNKFDNSKGYKFLTFARWHIVAGVTRTLDEVVSIPYHIKELIQAYKKAYNILSQRYNETPTERQIMAYMDITDKQMQSIKQYSKKATSLDKPLNDDDSSGAIFSDILQDHSADAQELLEQEDIKRIVNNAVDRLEDTQADIIKKKYFDNMPGDSIAKHYNLLPQQVRNIELKALIRLRRDYILKRESLDYRTPFYNRVSIQSFNNNRISSTEYAVLYRERQGAI